MIGVQWLDEAMKKAGFKYNKDLAEAAGVSPATVGNALKRGEVRESTAEKLQDACGEHPIGPLVDTDRVSGEEQNVSNPVDHDPESCKERFQESDCPTTSSECMKCWDILNTLDINLPINRAVCRTEHGWEVRGGYLRYRTPEGRLVENVYEYRES